MDIIQKLKIENLLEKRDVLTDIAVELYGEMFVCKDKFWGSPIEKDLEKVTNELFDLGWEYTPTLKERIVAKQIKKERG
jgi:hypothetical protein